MLRQGVDNHNNLRRWNTKRGCVGCGAPGKPGRMSPAKEGSALGGGRGIWDGGGAIAGRIGERKISTILGNYSSPDSTWS